MDDGDECFDLDNWEYGSDFGAPTDYPSGEVVVMIQGDSLDRAGLGLRLTLLRENPIKLNFPSKNPGTSIHGIRS